MRKSRSSNTYLPRECSLCGTIAGQIHPCEDGFVCVQCLDQGREGRDTTTKAARALRIAMTEQATANQLRDYGEDTQSHEQGAAEYAAKAAALFRPNTVPAMAKGEAIPPRRSELADTLTVPDMANLDASAHRLELLERLGLNCAAMALNAADSIQAGNSLEKMAAHQLAVAHKTALMLIDKATFAQVTVDKTALLNAACRMMDSYQRGMLRMQKINGEQAITMQVVTVTDGGQAIVTNINRGGK
jgi:hypothetical protein